MLSMVQVQARRSKAAPVPETSTKEKRFLSVQGMKNAGFQITTEAWINRLRRKSMTKPVRTGKMTFLSRTRDTVRTLWSFFAVYSTTPFIMPAGDTIKKSAGDECRDCNLCDSAASPVKVRTVSADKGDYYLKDEEYQDAGRYLCKLRKCHRCDQCRCTGRSFFYG